MNDIRKFGIGNTPLVKIEYEFNEIKKSIYSKLEYYNITGSIKDRVAFYIISKAIEKGEIKENTPIIEASSGNTAISLAALGAKYKNPVYIFMPNWVSSERVKILESYGAKVNLVSKEEGGFLGCVEKAEKLSQKLNGFLANQFSNKNNILAHYETTGKEILEEVPEAIGSFVSGVGTGGTLMGISKRLKEKYSNLQVTAIEPEKMPIISKGEVLGQHKIEGIGDDFIPDLLNKEQIDKIFLINDDDAINMSRKLGREIGLAVGISSGANFLGAVLANENKKEAVVTVFADDNKKYLSTELNKPINNDNTFLSNKIKLIQYSFI